MRANALFLFELVVFNGAALAWAGWEWWSVRPRKPPQADEPPPLSDPARHPEGQHQPHDRRP